MQPKNRISYYRDLRGLSQVRLGQLASIDPGQISKIENRIRRVASDQLSRIAGVLNVSISDLMAVDGLLPVVGRVGAGAKIYGIDDHPKGAALYFVPTPPNLPEGCVAVEVEGDSMPPLSSGWLVFYRKDVHGVPAEALNELCVVHLETGEYYLKRVKPLADGLFLLRSTNAPDIDDVRLQWAAPVLYISPPLPEIEPPSNQ